MKENPDKTLNGTHNKRLNNVRPTNNEDTAAWANAASKLDESQVTIPAEYNVEKAKNWVDNGSQL
ncbi:MAG: hypothetical protein K0S61_3042 [Anaerocolumna sp.]|jgi:hypothetical protein|nr:hypothetical protein [Anaerocolumna sp.]